MTLTFLTPWLLAGTALVAVPIIIHLILKKKPRHLFFPAFRFLQQKQRTNLQKLRLRHLLLLAMRIGLVVLICLALAGPELSGGPSELANDAPLRLVLLFDTSASMEYLHQGKSRLDVARESAEQLLEKLPASSQAAVLDTAEPGGQFRPLREAIKLVRNRRIQKLNRPVTAGLDEAYRLLESAKPDLPVLICIFSDRTAASWNNDLVSTYLQGARVRLAERWGGDPPHLYVDLSVKEPKNVAITGLAIKPADGGPPRPIEDLSLGSAPDRFQVQAAVQVTGLALDGELTLNVDGKNVDTQRLRLEAAPGQTAADVVTFAPAAMTRGVEQIIVQLKSGDLLEADNARYATLSLLPKKVLIIADEEMDAFAWRAALETLGPLAATCQVVSPGRTPETLHPEQYQAVCLLNVAAPDPGLWQKLDRYLAAGGGVIILPGEDCDPAAYNTEAALAVMPARLVDKRNLKLPGAFWAPTEFRHPILAYFKSQERQSLEYWRVYRFWDVEVNPDAGRTIVAYNSDDRPALVERIATAKQGQGKVLLFTTAMYRREGRIWKDWNNYHEGWFYLALAYLAAREVMGGREEMQNLLLGGDVRFWLPRTLTFESYTLSGPDNALAPVRKGESQLTVPEARQPGNYRVADPTGEAWVRQFSLNLPAIETQLVHQRPTESELEAFLGTGSVRALPPEANGLADLARERLGQSPKSNLLPYLMIGVLLLLALENLLANRFYRRAEE